MTRQPRHIVLTNTCCAFGIDRHMDEVDQLRLGLGGGGGTLVVLGALRCPPSQEICKCHSG